MSGTLYTLSPSRTTVEAFYQKRRMWGSELPASLWCTRHHAVLPKGGDEPVTLMAFSSIKMRAYFGLHIVTLLGL